MTSAVAKLRALGQGIADRKSTMPMLANVPFANAGQEPAARRRDRSERLADRGLKSTNASEGGITRGAKNLHDLIANAPGHEVPPPRAPSSTGTQAHITPADHRAPAAQARVGAPTS